MARARKGTALGHLVDMFDDGNKEIEKALRNQRVEY